MSKNWRAETESNRRLTGLQPVAFPLGYPPWRAPKVSIPAIRVLETPMVAGPGRIWWGRRDSNSQLTDLKSVASAFGLRPYLVGVVGLEPTISRL